jgi:predicted Zn finger-like uncharacterized protein
MPIAVICPGCHAQFRVSDKFAGKEGPCPKCKTVIKVPAVEEIKIHVPEEAAAAATSSQAAAASLRPTSRKKLELSPVLLTGIIGATIATLFIAWIAGDVFVVSFVLRAVGLVVLSVPIAAGGYEVLRDDELEAFRGAELWVRAAISGLVYAVLWGGFACLPGTLFANNWNWLFIPVPFLLIGWATAYFLFDLTSENAFFHYAFYLLLTILLRALIGMPALWKLAPAAMSPALL